MLRATQTTQNWLNPKDYKEQKTNKVIFSSNPPQTRENPRSRTPQPQNDDPFRSNLLSKIPMNSTIIGSANLLASPTGTPMNRSFVEDQKLNQNEPNGDSAMIAVTTSKSPKFVYSNAIDAFTMIENRKGFLNTSAINLASNLQTIQLQEAIVGVYCVRWRRTGGKIENETKLLVNCIGK